MKTFRRCRLFALLAAPLALGLASCAPRPSEVAPLAGGARRALYASGLGQRERRAAMVEETATLWPRAQALCDTCAKLRLPAVQADLYFSWPRSLRLRIASVFGTALDLGLAGDSRGAYAPAPRAGVTVDAARDSLGVADPGGLAVRVAAAIWRPPESAWSRGTWDAGWLVLRWREGEDSLRVAVDGAGRPARVRLERNAVHGLDVRYERWEVVDGVSWPMTLSVSDPGGTFALTSRVTSARFAPRRDSLRLAVQIPDDAERLGLEDLRRLLPRLERAR